MDRRRFLALLGNAIIAPPVRRYIEEEIDRLHVPDFFESGYDWGRSIEFARAVIPQTEFDEFRNQLARELIQAARKGLASGRRFEIRAMIPRDYGRVHGMAWYSSQEMMSDPGWVDTFYRAPNYLFMPHSGYLLVARQTV